MKNTRYVAVALSLFILYILFTTLFIQRPQAYSLLATAESDTPATGWLSGWQYRKMHNIVGATGAGSNYQIKIETYYDSAFSASNAANPLISNNGYLAENIVYDSVTGRHWWIFEDRSSSPIVIRMASATSLDGSWTVEPTPVISESGHKCGAPFIAKFGDYWYIYYCRADSGGPPGDIWVQRSSSVNTGYSTIGISNPILSRGSGSTWDNNRADEPCVILEGGTYYLFYMGENISTLYEQTGYATSSSPTTGFAKYSGNPVLPNGDHGWDSGQDKAADPFVFKYGNVFYIGVTATPYDKTNWSIGFYETTDFINFINYADNPVLSPGLSGSWDASAVLRGAVSSFSGTLYFPYAGFDGTSFRCGMNILKITNTDSGEKVYLNGHCRPDFGDIRFTKDDGVTPLDYWLESESDSSGAIFWVEIADDLSSANSAIYVYYGKSDATTTSNGANTFLFFDDFSGTLSKWITISGSWAVSGGTLTIEPPTGQNYWNNYLVTANPVATNAIAIRARVKAEQAEDVQAHPGLCWHANSLTGINQRNDQVYFRPHTYGRNASSGLSNIQPAYYDSNLNWYDGKFGSYFNWNAWNIIEVRIPSSGSVKLYGGDSYWHDWGNQQYSYDHIGCVAHEQGKDYWDYFLVHKYVYPEPLHGVWGSEELSYYLTLATSPTGVTEPVGEGWYEAGTYASISTNEYVNTAADTRYRFNGWTTTDMNEITNSSAASTTVLVDKNKTVTANYLLQYRLTFGQTGLDASATGTVVTVGSSAKTYADLPFSMWVDNGTSVSYSYEANVSSSVSGKRYRLGTVSGPPSPIIVKSPTNVTGNYVTQYYLTVTSPYDTPSGQGWYDAGSSAYATLANGTVSGGNGIRYVFTGWSGDASGTDLRSNAITMNGPKTATANWKTQYQVTFAQTGLDTTATGTVVTIDSSAKTPTDLPFSKWVDSGSSVTYTYADPVTSSVSGSRFKLSSVTGPVSPITVSGPTSVTASYKTQYQITFGQSGGDSDFTGTVVIVDGVNYARSGVSLWWDSGSSHNFAFQSPLAVGTNKRYMWTSTSGFSTLQSAPITTSASGTITANYEPQYYLDVLSSYGTVGGMGWYDSGATAYATVTPLIVNGSTGIRYVFTSWSGNALGTTSPSDPITMNAPKTATANYKTQYYIIVTSAHDSTTPSTWVDAGSDFSAFVTSPTEIVPKDHQWVCTGFSVDGGAYQTGTNYTLNSVQAAHTIDFAWKEQFWIVFQQTGLPDGVTANVVVNSVKHTLPYSDWFDQGLSVEFAYEDQLPRSIGTRYALTSTSDASPLEVGASINVTGYYNMQYTIEMFGLISGFIILGSLAIGIILVKRRKAKPV